MSTSYLWLSWGGVALPELREASGDDRDIVSTCHDDRSGFIADRRVVQFGKA